MPQPKCTETAFLDLKTGSNITHTRVLQPKDISTKLNASVTTIDNLLLKPKNQNDQPMDSLHRVHYLLARNNINKMNTVS